MELKERVRELAKKYHEDVVACRRHLHRHPELSFHEFETQKFVEGKLKEFGLTDMRRMANTGVVVLIKGGKAAGSRQSAVGKAIALRADMDALPIQETNRADYRSQHDGVMHACGHDVHTSSLLGAARILNELRSEFEGTVKLIFQPGEEKLPGGASMMIKEGVLENPKPDSVFGQHVMPQMDAGKVAFRKGLYMASTDELYVTVKGKGGHAAIPKSYNNPLLIASQILTELNKEFMVNDNSNPRGTPTVLAFGKFIANGATNVIPDEVKLDGTFRTMNEAWRDEAHSRMKKMAEGIAKEMGGECEFNIVRGYPFLINDEGVTERARHYAEDYLGKENVGELEMWMAAEDFAFYSQKAPSCFYRLGVRNEKRGITSSVHTSTFDIDEAALATGMGLMAWIALNELNS